MGICQHELVFQTATPNISCIADQITLISGLPIVIQESNVEEISDSYKIHGYLALRSNPKNTLEIYVERNTKTVSTKIYLGQEETLFFVTTFALEALGGTLTSPMPNAINDQYRQKYRQKITPFQLQLRSLKVGALVLTYWMIGIIAIPIILPVWTLKSMRFCYVERSRPMRRKRP
jgi:hypothetical protein